MKSRHSAVTARSASPGKVIGSEQIALSISARVERLNGERPNSISYLREGSGRRRQRGGGTSDGGRPLVPGHARVKSRGGCARDAAEGPDINSVVVKGYPAAVELERFGEGRPGEVDHFGSHELLSPR